MGKFNLHSSEMVTLPKRRYIKGEGSHLETFTCLPAARNLAALGLLRMVMKTITLLCVALVSCQQASAIWPFPSGERSSNGNAEQTYVPANVANYGDSASYTGAQVEGQQQGQFPLITASDYQDMQNQIAAEAKNNYGTKGNLRRLFSRNKVSTGQQVYSPIVYAPQPENIFDNGYLDPVPNLSVTPNVTEATGKTKLRGFLPWNWVVTGNGATGSIQNVEHVQPFQVSPSQLAAPKRSWAVWPINPRPVVPLRPNQYCQCYYPQVQQFQSGGNGHESVSEATVPRPESESNVRQVTPSESYYGEESNPVPKIVPALSTQQQHHHQLQQQGQQQVQHQIQQGVQASSLSPSVNEQLMSTHQQAVAPSLPMQYATPYQTNVQPSHSHNSGIVNPQALPASHYQSTTGDGVQQTLASS